MSYSQIIQKDGSTEIKKKKKLRRKTVINTEVEVWTPAIKTIADHM